MSSLKILLASSPLGELRQASDGRLEVVYDEGYAGPPLSLSMPVGNASYGDKVVRPYLLGLLPDDFEQRRTLAREHHVSANNPFQLLRFVGLDCPGAVQFVEPERIGEAMARPLVYVPLSRAQIGEELRRIRGDGFPSWQSPNERWSLGGAQAKLALARLDGRWYRCEGAAATTHILKPGIQHLKSEALNEVLCQRLAARAGVAAARSAYELFNGEPAIVVERFDRRVRGRIVTRLHQEDLCQALAVLPENKYASEGGPSARDIVQLLRKHNHGEENVLAFTAELFFNYLMGAPDAHGKNYSVLLHEDGPSMAPLYDCASGFPYQPERGRWTMAMGIGGERAFGRVGEGALTRYAQMAGIEPGMCVALMGNLATRILEELDGVLEEMRQELAEAGVDGSGLDELAGRIKPEVVSLCERTLSMLDA